LTSTAYQAFRFGIDLAELVGRLTTALAQTRQFGTVAVDLGVLVIQGDTSRHLL